MEYSQPTTRYFEDVYEVCKLIPYGRVSTYGAIAAYLGRKGGARMVGWAMNASHAVGGINAHRVVNSQGLLTGKHHFGSPELMQGLLESEGIKVVGDKVQNFKELLWEPVKELSL